MLRNQKGDGYGTINKHKEAEEIQDHINDISGSRPDHNVLGP